MTVLDDASEVCVAGPGPRDNRSIGTCCVDRGLRLDGHGPPPVFPVFVRDEESDWRPSRGAVTYSAQDLRAIGLNRHAPPTTVAALPPAQIGRDGFKINGQSRRHALDDRHERLAVR